MIEKVGMTVKYNVVSYLIGEGFKNVLKNKKSTMSALTIMCLCMLVFGIFFLIGENINHMMKTLQEEQGMQVFFNIGTSQERIDEIGNAIKNLNGVNTIKFVSSSEGLNEIKESYKENANALDGISEEIIPESYVVTLSDLGLYKQVNNDIEKIVGSDLDSIESSNQTISILMSVAKGIRIFTFALLVVLVIISLVIISNTIKLTVHARRKEISIMKYVGATNSFIRWPFIVEGITIGIVASLIAILIVGIGYNLIIQNVFLGTETVKTLNLTFVSFSDMFNLMILVYLGLGIGIGVIGSIISMRKYLEV